MAARTLPPPRRPTSVAVPDPVEIADPLRYLQDSGLLFEINRTFLHPFGLVMAIRPVDDRNPRKGLEPVIFDASNNPELAVFEPDVFERGVAKKQAWWKNFGFKAHAFRVDRLGFSVQTKPNYKEQQRNKGG